MLSFSILSLLMDFAVSLGASLTAQQLDDVAKRVKKKRKQEWLKLLQSHSKSRSLREDCRLVGIELVRIKDELGFGPQEAPLLELFQEVVFLDDLATYIQSFDLAKREAIKKSLNERMAEALIEGGVEKSRIDRFSQEYFELFESLVFSESPRSFRLFQHGQVSILEALGDQKKGIHSILGWIEDREKRAALEKELEADIQRRKSIARCRNLFAAAGIVGPLEREFAEDSNIGRREIEIPSRAEAEVFIVTGEMGIGKSLFIERLFQEALDQFVTGPEYPIPVILRSASDPFQDLISKIKDQSEKLGDTNERGIEVFMDGYDEGGLKRFEEIVAEAFVAARTLPDCHIIISCRSASSLRQPVSGVVISQLNEEETLDLICRVSGFEQAWHQVSHLDEKLRESIRRPLFAILFGVFIRSRGGRGPNSRAELVSYLVDCSISRASEFSSQTHDLIREIAKRSTEKEGRPVRKEELIQWEDNLPLLESRLVVEDDGMISFPLPVIREWFAARWLLKNQDFIDEAVRDPHRLALWQNPLAIAIGTGRYDDGIRLMTPIVRNHPGIASMILEDAVADPWIPYKPDPINFEECGHRIRETMRSWISGIPTTSGFIFPLKDSGDLPTLGISQTIGGLETAWYIGPEEKEETVLLENTINLLFRGSDRTWQNTRMGFPSRQAAWAWKWTQDDLRNNLSSFLKFRCLTFPNTPLEQELFWGAALKLTNKGSYFTKPIPLEELIPVLESAVQSILEVDRFPVNLESLLEFSRSLINEGRDVVESPWPQPDLSTETGFGWTWFSDKRLVERMQSIYSAALDGYQRFVAATLPELGPTLQIWAAFPAKLVGAIQLQEDPNRHGGCPWLEWHLEPLESDQTSSVEITISNKSLSRQDHRQLYGRFREARPEFADWLTYSIPSQAIPVLSSTLPANELLFQWLWRDLECIHWVEGLCG